MDRSTAVGMCSPLFQPLKEIILLSHQDYRTGVPIDHQATLDATARANYVHCRMLFHLLIRYGDSEAGAIRLAGEGKLRWLFVQGEPKSAGLRPKKVGRFDLLSSNVDTARQISLRDEGEFLWQDSRPAHLIFGYTERGGNADAEIERIVMTNERGDGIDWWHLIYHADEGQAGVPIDTGFDQPPLVPTVKIRPTAKPAAGGATPPKRAEADKNENQSG